MAEMTIFERASLIRMVIMDVDGVLTDGGMYYGENGEEFKQFNTRDGKGIALLHEAGIRTAIVTSEQTNIVARRAKKLNIEEVYQGVRDKLPVVERLLANYNLAPEAVCYIGDDMGDLEIFGKVGLAVAVDDAILELKRQADYVTQLGGGRGAVREVCELILKAKGLRGG